VVADHLRELEAIDLGHPHIHEDHGDVRFQQILQGFPGRTSLQQMLAELMQDRLIGEQLVRLIID
jgi:hypothetical protein